MRTLREPAAALLVALTLALTACGGNSGKDSSPTGAERDDSWTDGVKPPANDQAIPPGGKNSNENGDGFGNLPNNDPTLLKMGNPCRIVTSQMLSKHFATEIVNGTGITNPEVTDKLNNTRVCEYEGYDAKIDGDGRYSLKDVVIFVTTEIDDDLGTLWKADVANGTTVNDDLIKVDTGWYQRRFGKIIVELREQTNEITDQDAMDLLDNAKHNFR